MLCQFVFVNEISKKFIYLRVLWRVFFTDLKFTANLLADLKFIVNLHANLN